MQNRFRMTAMAVTLASVFVGGEAGAATVPLGTTPGDVVNIGNTTGTERWSRLVGQNFSSFK